MFKWILQRLAQWRSNRRYKRYVRGFRTLPRSDQTYVRSIKCDPESLLANGYFKRGRR